MKKNLFIIGANSFGREIESWLALIPEERKDFQIVGFLDINNDALDKYPSDFKIVGNESDYCFGSNDYVIIAIADVKIKQHIYHRIRNKVRFYSFIGHNVTMGKFSTFGEGIIVCPNTMLSTNIVLGNCVIINTGCHIGHDVVIGHFSSLMSSITIGGGSKIGEGVYIGTNATIIPKRVIGNNSKIGTGSVVIRNVKDEITVFGNPAKKIYK